MRKTSNKIRLGDMLQNTSPVCLKTVKVRKNKERSGNSQSRDSETGQQMQCGTLDWIPKQEEDVNGKPDEIQIKSRVSTCQ